MPWRPTGEPFGGGGWEKGGAEEGAGEGLIFWQVKVPFRNVVLAIDYPLAVKFVPIFRRIRDSIDVLEIHGPRLKCL